MHRPTLLSRAASVFTTPRSPQDFLRLVDPLASSRQLRGAVTAVVPEGPDAATIRFRPGRGWQAHQPGQWVRIGVEIDGVRHWRAYSLTHRADGTAAAGIPAGCVAITTKAIPDGKVSNHLVRATAPGTLVMLDQATGDFTLPTPAPAKALFLTAGSGITPVVGMLRNSLDELPDVAHLHCAPTASDVIFAGELRSYAADGRLARSGELLERGVRARHVGLVVLVVVQLHDPRGDVGLQRPVVVGQGRQRVLGHGLSSAG